MTVKKEKTGKRSFMWKPVWNDFFLDYSFFFGKRKIKGPKLDYY